MKVILKTDIKGVGRKDDIINANDGYARNFLFPKQLAVEANKENLAKLKEKKDSEAYRKEQELEKAKEQAAKISGLTLELRVKAGENGKIFGGITSKEISEVLKEKHNIEIDKKRILLPETIKILGRFSVEIKLYEGVIGKLAINVEPL